MRKKLYTTLVALLAAAVYFIAITGLKGSVGREINANTYSGGEKSETISTRDTFTNCIFNSEYSEIVEWGKPKLLITQSIDRYKELNFNAIHLYDAWGSGRYGVPDSVLSLEQINNFKGVLDSVEEGNLFGFYERSHLSKYCYGQRLIYEVPVTPNDSITNSGFVYRNSDRGSYETDSGRTVLHAIPGVQDTGYLCKGIYENLQHSDLFDFRQNDKGTWYIKPVMRIPTGMNPGIPVVRIEIIPFGGGDPVKQITINTDNFLDGNFNYDGSYLEKYFRLSSSLQISGNTNSTDLNHGRDENWSEWDNNCKVDFRVYWYGECEVWFDKMIVDDGTADRLFNTTLQTSIINPRIQQEVTYFTNYGSLYSFFMDEICISQYPCLQYVAKKMREYSTGSNRSKLSIAVTNYLHVRGLRNDGLSYQVYLDSIQPNFLQCDHHGFSDNEPRIPAVFPNPDGKIPQSWFTTTANYNNNLQNKVFGSTTDVVTKNEVGTLIYEIKKTRTSISSNYTGTKFIMQPQIHGFIFTDTNTGNYNNGLREPTNEEIQAQTMISIAHGAEGICWFIYNSHIWKTKSDKVKQYMLGLLAPENDTAKRIVNDYKQNKWQYVSSMNGKIEKWREVLEQVKWTGGYSVHSEGANHNFISDIRSIYRNPSGIFTDEPNCINCDVEKYWEEGFFEPDDLNDLSKYLIMVNRRCIPEVETGVGDKRVLKIKFNVSQLQGFNNWVIEDVNTGEQIIFDKNTQISGGYLNLGTLGEFEPGEGKLFKLAPVMQEGGTLITDENIENLSSFDCKDMVYGNGHNITIGQGVTINFADTAGIEMQIGNFLCGNDNTFGSTQVTLKPKVPSAGWNGVSVSDGGILYIYNTIFENPKSGKYSLTFANCSEIKVKYCTFNNNSDLNNNGGIMINVYISNAEPVPSYISNNLFVMKGSNLPALNINSTAGSSTNPVIVEYNTFNTVTSSLEAISFTNVSGGEIKDNSITNYEKGIKLIVSSTNIFNNYITSNLPYSIGIEGYNNEMVMGSSGSYFIGGLNNIILTGNNSNSFKMTNSYFDVDFGKNTFDIPNSSSLMHWTGYFPEDMQSTELINARKNCFKVGGTNDTARHDITIGYGGEPANIEFEEYDCGSEMPEDYEVITQSDGYLDTIYINTGGEGASGRDKITNKKADKKTELTSGKSGKAEIVTYKSLKDSITILIRRRNFQEAEMKLKQILTIYSDSSYALNTPGLLFYCVSQQDTSTEKHQQTKTFYETAIQNNQGKPELLKRLFYYIQKCKVKLGQYSSALEGFLYIMQNNQYNMLGLIASWDYAATQLLMGSGGIGSGGMRQEGAVPEEINDSIRFSKKVELTKIRDGYDEKKFTKEDRKKIITNIETAMEYEKKRDENNLEKMKDKLKGRQKDEKNKENPNDDAENMENQLEREIEKIEKIKETVKIKKPKTEKEYIEIMNKDMIKVFGSELKKESLTRNKTEIPTSYELRQNYPNPFNPVTKISFSLPKESRVKLIIYDILGREVKRILNNEIKTAGTYTEEFNGINLSSGVYFLRIIVNEGKDFVDVKKMVLIK